MLLVDVVVPAVLLLVGVLSDEDEPYKTLAVELDDDDVPPVVVALLVESSVLDVVLRVVAAEVVLLSELAPLASVMTP